MPDSPARSSAVSRYETIVATLVGICALGVSAFTAYTQRQQVRAVVWPILEYDTSNEPSIRLSLANKGVGPAVIRHVLVKVDGEPVSDWKAALQKLLGPGAHPCSISTMTGRVLAAGETINILLPYDAEGKPLTRDKSGTLGTQMDQARGRVTLEICYSSTLGDCWTLRSSASGGNITTETRRCPASSAATFQQ